MSAVAFDTLKFARALKEKAHLSTEQAEGFAEAIADATSQQLVTKSDLAETKAELKSDLAETKAELKAELAETKAELKADIAETKAELKAEIAAVRGDVALLKWMLGFVLALLSAVTLKLFLR